MDVELSSVLFGQKIRMVDEGFWNGERELLIRILLPLIRSAAQAGARSALSGLSVGVDWALVNRAVLAWVNRYVNELATGIIQTSKSFVWSSISDWIESGDPLDELIKTLSPMFGQVRAEMIGVTEVTRAFAEGNMAAWKESGVVDGVRWMTGEDDLVCEICLPLEGTEADFGGAGFTTEQGEEALGIEAPPAHTRCRCYLQPVVKL